MTKLMNIENLRDEIDRIDDELRPLFIRRIKLAKIVAENKKNAGGSLNNSTREREILRRIVNDSDDFSPWLQRYYTNIFELSKARQKTVLYTTGLLGETLSHSRSPILHTLLGNDNYKLFEVPENQISSFFEKRDFYSINVTIPYKKTAVSFCDYLSPTAKLCGNVNLICNRNGKLYGYNTDLLGFIALLRSENIDVTDKRCLVLGSGGAGSTVCAALKLLMAADITTISRSGKDNYSNISDYNDAQIIINTTPVGLNGEEPLVNLYDFPSLTAVVDIIANPYRTKLLTTAKQRGLKYSNGLTMLTAQAVIGFSLFFDIPYSFVNFGKLYFEFLLQNINLVFIGMPGCGKTTIGQLVAKKLNLEFCDIDMLIEKDAGSGIEEIFKSEGEAGFRERECRVLNEILKHPGKIVATGGGVVEQSENRSALLSSAKNIYLKSDIAELETTGRPLSKDKNTLQQIYLRRGPLYEQCADLTIQVQKTPQQTCDVIIQKIYTDCIDFNLDLGEFTQFV